MLRPKVTVFKDDQYLAGNLMNYELKDEDIQKNLDEIKDM